MCVWLFSGGGEMLKETLKNQSIILPHYTSLPDGRDIIIDTMTECHLKQVWHIVQEAAQNNDGFGADEFPTEDTFRDDIKGGSGFAILNKESGEMIAAFVLAISKYYRGQNVVDPFVIVQRCERRRGIGELCFQLCVQYAGTLGYMGMYVDTFSSNTAMIKIIERSGGFQKVGYLPMGGRTKDGDIIGSFIYYRDLRVT
ncbi:uncharacterized protein LOC124131680 isoform X1 [Haliotis rufescens]|uniref:uncharacterized protein LOC124131680 isoform X1 n=2 Tax=Haliotis rufescens TaxID=6454 RepID=UPI001EAF990E|nr:uncharacterized protein LOC124131680 isoform X1 [Haliotis rufescens]